MGRPDWVPTKWSCVCSTHFHESDLDKTSLSRVRIKEGAVPTVCRALSSPLEQQMMEKTKRDTSVHSKHYNFIGRTEKICRKCGFATFCLRVLYKHKYKCQGKLLGPSVICCYCKKKFSFYSLLWK
ncbi:hypothetical protein X975_22364, partial [Stegodyphus mimosarum]